MRIPALAIEGLGIPPVRDRIRFPFSVKEHRGSPCPNPTSAARSAGRVGMPSGGDPGGSPGARDQSAVVSPRRDQRPSEGLAMLSRLRSRVNHATVVAYLALFIALGGVGYAAATLPANSVGTRQLKNGAVTKRKLANGAVTTRKLARGFSAPPSGRASGDLTGSYPHPAI